MAPGGGGTIGGVPKATSARGEDPWGSQPGPRRHSQEEAERRPVPRGQFGDSGRARSIFGGSEATPDLPARQRARGRRRGGARLQTMALCSPPPSHGPSPVPALPGSSVPQSMAREQGGRGSGGGVVAPGGPRVAPRWSRAVLCHGAGGERGSRAAPSQNLGAAPPGRAQPAAHPQGAWLGAGTGGAQSGCSGGCSHPLRPPAPPAPLRRPSRSAAAISVCVTYK